MVDKTRLRDRTVIVRIAGVNTTLTATVSYVENDGLWLIGSEIVANLSKATGGLPLGITTPAVYVPFSQLLWLIAPND